MSQQQIYLLWIVLLPLCTALLNAFVFRNRSIVLVCAVATMGVFGAFLLAINLYLSMVLSNVSMIELNLFPWISIPNFQGKSLEIPFSIVVDKLSILFLFVTTGIGSLIHFYSGQYMDSEKKPYRFFVYMNLFIVSMIVLVLGSNMLVTFLGWEGVGVCSYLLVGYWFEDKNNSLAAIKAFIMNRIGDAGFLLAMFLCLKYFSTLDYSLLAQSVTIFTNSNGMQTHSLVILLIGLGLLVGVAGKSAQIPLYTWLPDAMAGPTPVSALIHAATMVTAGIYLLNRMSFILILSPAVMHTIAIIGAATALLSATIALAQTDIKKVLAYSTCSQLGLMILACGVGTFGYGVAHVITHAFFKACLFLAAGSVIYALHHEQDIRKMGGLFKKMPITSLTFLIGVLAIIGLPPLSGFFTKDAILVGAWAGPYGHPLLWLAGYITTGLTAFYMLRLTVLVFFGRCRAPDPSHIHETSPIMTIPLIILAFLSAFGGFVILLFPAVHIPQALERNLMLATTALVVVSACFAIFLYRKGIHSADAFSKKLGLLYRLVRDKWRVDELYQFAIVAPLEKLGQFFYKFVDRCAIEGTVNGVPKVFYFGVSIAGDMQSGNVRNYLKLFFFSMIVLFFVLAF